MQGKSCLSRAACFEHPYTVILFSWGAHHAILRLMALRNVHPCKSTCVTSRLIAISLCLGILPNAALRRFCGKLEKRNPPACTDNFSPFFCLSAGCVLGSCTDLHVAFQALHVIFDTMYSRASCLSHHALDYKLPFTPSTYLQVLTCMLLSRPVDCYTHEPLVFLPGFVNSTIYGDQVETGWTYGPYFLHSANFWLQGNTPVRFCLGFRP